MYDLRRKKYFRKALPFTNNKSRSKKYFGANASQGLTMEIVIERGSDIFLAHSVKQNEKKGKNKQKVEAYVKRLIIEAF